MKGIRWLAPAALAAFAPLCLAVQISTSTILSGPQENPPNNSTATGFATVTLDTTTHRLRVAVTFSGLTSNTTMAHIHCCTSAPNNVGVATTVPAFVGFPLQETTPVSVRGSIAAYWTTQQLVNGELVIDKSSWAGMSGGPVFLGDGSVIGIVTNRGTKTREGMTMARPAWLIEEALANGKE